MPLGPDLLRRRLQQSVVIARVGRVMSQHQEQRLRLVMRIDYWKIAKQLVYKALGALHEYNVATRENQFDTHETFNSALQQSPNNLKFVANIKKIYKMYSHFAMKKMIVKYK